MPRYRQDDVRCALGKRVRSHGEACASFDDALMPPPPPVSTAVTHDDDDARGVQVELAHGPSVDGVDATQEPRAKRTKPAEDPSTSSPPSDEVEETSPATTMWGNGVDALLWDLAAAQAELSDGSPTSSIRSAESDAMPPPPPPHVLGLRVTVPLDQPPTPSVMARTPLHPQVPGTPLPPLSTPIAANMSHYCFVDLPSL